MMADQRSPEQSLANGNPLISAEDEELHRASKALLHRELAQTRALRENVRRLSAQAEANAIARERTRSANPTQVQPVSNRPPSASGELPVDTATFRQQLERFYSRHNPEKISSISSLIEQHPDAQSQARLKFRLLRKYDHVPINCLNLAWRYAQIGSTSTGPCFFCCSAWQHHDNFASDLIRFYERYNPSKLSDPAISKIVLSSRNSDDVDLGLVKIKLLLKYQLFPSPDIVAELVCTDSPCCNTPEALKFSVTRFYAAYNSEKINEVGATIARFGMEKANELKFKLLVKYGFVPVENDSGQLACDLLLNGTTIWQFRTPKKPRLRQTPSS